MTLRVLSLGWGVQSWTLAAMAANGDIPAVDLAIHADTRFERSATYAFAEKWTPWLAERGVKVETAKANNADGSVLRWSRKSVMLPAYTLDGAAEGQLRRQCTSRWKIEPLRQALRKHLPKQPKAGAVEMLIGISKDEWSRQRTSEVAYIVNRYPLVDLGMTRADCVAYLRDHGLPVPPKSSCTFCPYHNDRSWQELKRTGGPDWEQAVAVDAEIRELRPPWPLFVHRGRVALADAVTIPEDHGHTQAAMFDDDEAGCVSGTCFV
jgi:hypothetical protein